MLYFIKSRLGVGNIKKENKTNIFTYKIRDRQKLAHIINIFDRYPLLTKNYFDYLKFKEAYTILENTNLSKVKQDELIYALVRKVPSEGYISPAWKIVNYKVSCTNEAKTVIFKPWLVGYIEAKGSFYLINKSNDSLVHGFEITTNLCFIIKAAIGKILGIKNKAWCPKSTTHAGASIIQTTNSRAIENIIKYFHNTMKGMKSLSFKLWLRAHSILNSNMDNEKKFKKLNKINKLLIKTNSKLKSTNLTLSQKFNRSVHTNSNNSNINPYYITGF